MTDDRTSPAGADAKDEQLRAHRVDNADTVMTTDQGIRVEDTNNGLRAGTRGPTLLEDFHLREKVMRFDHERIPERVVHARGSGAHGYFEPYSAAAAEYTQAPFLTDPGVRTPVFARFSTVAGSRGSADTVRDVRGFAVKFYTQQGNWDLVGNNMPVFFIQDAIKFPDVIHAVKPEPQFEMPQAASAHDSFWDFASLQPETMHHVMWLMSDRALPRSYRTMQGFGVHTYRFINAQGAATFVKFHWKPIAGIHSLVWDEVLKVAGADPDFNRRDLWDAIDGGRFPEFELGVQLIAENQEFAFDDIDLLDSTKIIPEERVPVTPLGRMVLNRNPDNFFAETEQVAFCISNIVPGIDFTDDPLLQARLFSYLDTQITRLGGPNFAQIPINQPLPAVRSHQQDGFHQDTIPTGGGNYHPNTIGGGCPVVPGAEGGAFVHRAELVDGRKTRKRSETFADHYGQATMFWNSMSDWEKEHIVAAFQFELGKVNRMSIRTAVVENLNHIDRSLATLVAAGIGVSVPTEEFPNHGRRSPAVSQANQPTDNIVSRKVAILVANGVHAARVHDTRSALLSAGAVVEVVAPLGAAVDATGERVPVDKALATVASVLYDAVVIADGEQATTTLASDGYAVHFVAEAYKHQKAIGVLGSGAQVLLAAHPPAADSAGTDESVTDGIVVLTAGEPVEGPFIADLINAIAKHRHFTRPVGGVVA